MINRKWQIHAHGVQEYGPEDVEAGTEIHVHAMIAHNLAVIAERLEAVAEALDALTARESE